MRREVEKRMTAIRMATKLEETLHKLNKAAERRAAQWLAREDEDFAAAVEELVIKHKWTINEILEKFDDLYQRESSKAFRVQVGLAAKWAERQRDAG
jgi:hypothetical protein